MASLGVSVFPTMNGAGDSGTYGRLWRPWPSACPHTSCLPWREKPGSWEEVLGSLVLAWSEPVSDFLSNPGETAKHEHRAALTKPRPLFHRLLSAHTEGPEARVEEGQHL